MRSVPIQVAKYALLGAVCVVGGGTTARAEDAPALRKTLEDRNAAGAEFWIYNDIQKGMEEARRQNKPLLVTFRCVPCEACKSFDAEVAQGSDAFETLAREQFVTVRQVEMKGVDLSLFQFDHDLNWAAMFLNADGVVYARYGTQSADGPDAYNSIEGLLNTMRRVLKLHAAYPGNANELKGKRGPQTSYRTALDMPGLEDKNRFRGETTRKNCIHCHNIHDAEQRHAQANGTFTADMLWRYPLPDQMGMVIDAKDGVRIGRVLEDSPAETAGFQPGESVVRMNGQPITSIADMQWVLHQLPNRSGEVTVEGSRSGRRRLSLPDDWKRADISWRGSLWSLSPRLRIWMPELTAAQKRAQGVPADQSALLVKWINVGSQGGRAARSAGLREGDVVVALAGQPIEMTTKQFNLHVKLNYKVGEKLPLTVLRNGNRREVNIELVE